MKKAAYVEQGKNSEAICHLCPHHCTVREGKSGICRVRTNHGGILYSANYGKVCSMSMDPIEKKPLYHFFPGRNILSAGSVGCNLQCLFCQNYEISQTGVDEYPHLHDYSPADILSFASRDPDNLGIAYTYNEPAVWYEFMYDIARLASQKGLKNVMVTNGYISPEPLEDIFPYMDAFGVDLKAFTDRFYKKLTHSTLDPVLDTLKRIRKAGKHLEITNLIIPGENDDDETFENMVRWIAKNLGKETVLHLSKYFPTYKLSHPSTPASTLERLAGMASKHLDYVFIGNTWTKNGQNTRCPSCGNLVIRRTGYSTSKPGLDKDGKCMKCGRQVLDRDCIS